MLVQNWSFPSALFSHKQSSSSSSSSSSDSLIPSIPTTPLIPSRSTKVGRSQRASFSSNTTCQISIGFDDFADIIHNRVLIAAALSGAIGQLLKPFTSTLFYRKSFDFKAAFQPGGFPSTHSSAVVATATSLALERGFADSIFGLAVVYAALIMYDAQGVRREVGTHAKTINRVFLKTQVNSVSSRKIANDLSDSSPRKSSTTLQSSDPIFLNQADGFRKEEKKDSLLVESNPELISTNIASDIKGSRKSVAFSYSPLKESVGHTETEVIAGAFLGFFVSLAVCVI